MLAAVTEKGCVLQYASEELCGDKQVVLAAVTENGCALEYASEELRGHKEIVLAAIENDVRAWVSVAFKTALRRDPKIAAALVAKEKAVHMLKQLAKRRSTCDALMNSVDYSIALIARRFGDDATILEAAQEASAKFHSPWTMTGQWSAPHKRSRASYEHD